MSTHFIQDITIFSSPYSKYTQKYVDANLNAPDNAISGTEYRDTNANVFFPQRFLAILKASKEEREIIASLKAIGNTGMPDFLRVLTLVAKDEAKPTAVRAQAIYSLRYIAKIVPRKVNPFIISKTLLLRTKLSNRNYEMSKSSNPSNENKLVRRGINSFLYPID